MPKKNTRAGTTSASESQQIPKWLVPTGFCTGIVSLVIVLWIAVCYPTPSAFLFNVMRTVMALGGAAFSTALSGRLAIRLNLPGKGYIVAGGTLAMFVLLYFFPPAGLQSTQMNNSVSAPTSIIK